MPGLVGFAYQHETSRCGDPHLHTHVIVPNRQARTDGALVSIDSKSLYHEAKAAGIVYQATLRHELHAELGAEWSPVDPFTGMAAMAAVDKHCLKAWSQRSTRLRDWAHNNLVVVETSITLTGIGFLGSTDCTHIARSTLLTHAPLALASLPLVPAHNTAWAIRARTQDP